MAVSGNFGVFYQESEGQARQAILTGGDEIAREALCDVGSEVAGVYSMPPFNRVESALEILRNIPDQWPDENTS